MPTQHLLELKQDSCLVSAWQLFKIKWLLLSEQDAPIARDEDRFRHTISEELLMHDITFHQPDVLKKITEEFSAL